MKGNTMTADRGGTRGVQRMTPAAVKILDAASRLFYAEGIRAIGVETIAAEAGVTKKTLYDRFGSKDDLIMAYLRARDGLWRTTLVTYVNECEGNAEQKLLATFKALREWMRDRNPRGCAFVNAHVELPADHPGQEITREQKIWMLSYLEDLAAEAQVADPELLASRLLILHEGACIANSMHSVDDAATHVEQMASMLIRQSLQVSQD